MAVIEWGDTTTTPSSAEETFNDAFGGVTGNIGHHHAYAAPGIYNLVLTVTDDDVGSVTAGLSLKIVTPLEAAESVVDEIDALLAALTDPDVLDALRAALEKLDGSRMGAAENGAIDKLDVGNLAAALVKLAAAVEALAQSEAAGGPEVSALEATLALAAHSIAQAAFLEAVDSVDPANDGEARQLAEIQAALAARLLAGGDYRGAVLAFLDATQRAAALAN